MNDKLIEVLTRIAEALEAGIEVSKAHLAQAERMHAKNYALNRAATENSLNRELRTLTNQGDSIPMMDAEITGFARQAAQGRHIFETEHYAELNRLRGESVGKKPAPAPLPKIATKIIGDLEWQLLPAEKKMTWEAAKAYAASLGDGWRLPTVQELVSLWDYDKGCCEAFPDAKGWFWSSFPNGSSNAWCVYFNNGHADFHRREYNYGVRCVRDMAMK